MLISSRVEIETRTKQPKRSASVTISIDALSRSAGPRCTGGLLSIQASRPVFLLVPPNLLSDRGLAHRDFWPIRTAYWL